MCRRPSPTRPSARVRRACGCTLWLWRRRLWHGLCSRVRRLPCRGWPQTSIPAPLCASRPSGPRRGCRRCLCRRQISCRRKWRTRVQSVAFSIGLFDGFIGLIRLMCLILKLVSVAQAQLHGAAAGGPGACRRSLCGHIAAAFGAYLVAGVFEHLDGLTQA